MEQYDAIIIGFGKAGKTLASDLGAKGKSVALIEKSDKMYGGTCINVGCIPTKSLVKSAIESKQYGFDNFVQKSEFYKKAINDKENLIKMLRTKNYNKLSKNENITIYNGEASFIKEHEINIDFGNEKKVIFGENIFINTGSIAVLPDLEGLTESKLVYTSESMLSLDKLPEKLVIIGGGYIGLEFASIYSNFGTDVTIIQKGNEFLPREDTQISGSIRNVLESHNVKIIMDAKMISITDKNQSVILKYNVNGEDKTIESNAILIATGRKPNTSKLNLDRVGIEMLPNGGIKVNKSRQTNKSNIWAMGDVVGEQQFTYVSLDDYRVVKAAIEGKNFTAQGRTVPYSVFIDPPFSRVGITGKEAKEQGYNNIKEVVLSAEAIPKANILKNSVGLLKAVVDLNTNLILGVSLFCEESHEMINLVKLVMDNNLPYTVLRDQMFTHPTMSESLNELFNMV